MQNLPCVLKIEHLSSTEALSCTCSNCLTRNWSTPSSWGKDCLVLDPFQHEELHFTSLLKPDQQRTSAWTWVVITWFTKSEVGGIGPVKPVHMVFSDNEGNCSRLCWNVAATRLDVLFMYVRKILLSPRGEYEDTPSSSSTAIMMMWSCTVGTKALVTAPFQPTTCTIRLSAFGGMFTILYYIELASTTCRANLIENNVSSLTVT